MFNAGKAFVNYNISKRLFSTNYKVALEWTPNTNHVCNVYLYYIIIL